MMTEYASGNAANNPPPPSTSQVSLPSHTGAMEFIAVSRSLPTGKAPNITPMPRSKPSMTTYMKTANPRIPAQMLVSATLSAMRRSSGGRGAQCRRRRDACRVCRRVRVLGLLRMRRARHELEQVPAAHAEHREIDHDERNQ